MVGNSKAVLKSSILQYLNGKACYIQYTVLMVFTTGLEVWAGAKSFLQPESLFSIQVITCIIPKRC